MDEIEQIPSIDIDEPISQEHAVARYKLNKMFERARKLPELDSVVLIDTTLFRVMSLDRFEGIMTLVIHEPVAPAPNDEPASSKENE